MATKLPEWQKGSRITPANLESFFSKYGDSSPLSSAMTNPPEFGRLQSPPNPVIEGVPKTEIPPSPFNNGTGLTPMPIGQGTWFNRPRESALTQAQTRKFTEQEKQQAREEAKIELLIQQNPEIFLTRTPETFINSREAETFLKNEKDRIAKQKDFEEKQRHNKAMENKGAKAEKKPLFGTGGGAAPAAQPAAPVTGATFKF